MKTITDGKAKLPSEFRGCQWNDGWEFDAPAVIYYPRQFRRFGCGGNTGAIDDLVDEICMDLAENKTPDDGGLEREIQWRGWGLRFERRREAWHVVYKIRWFTEDGALQWKVTKRTEKYGIPAAWRVAKKGAK